MIIPCLFATLTAPEETLPRILDKMERENNREATHLKMVREGKERFLF